MNIFVTGGTGFIGSYVLQAALAANPQLLNALSGAQDPNDPSGVKLNPDVIKAYSDVTAGKTNVQNTALLAQFAEIGRAHV